MDAITPERFGVLIAQAIVELRSSATGFLISKALEYAGIDSSLSDWGAMYRMVRRISGLPEVEDEE